MQIDVPFRKLKNIIIDKIITERLTKLSETIPMMEMAPIVTLNVTMNHKLENMFGSVTKPSAISVYNLFT